MTINISDFASYTALVPMRAQPLHLGHVNLLLNLAQHFERIMILLSPKHDDTDNFFSFAQRTSWLLQIQQKYSLDFSIQTLPRFQSPIDQTKSSSAVQSTQKAFRAVGGDDFLIVTGNNRVIDACQKVYDFDCMHVQDLAFSWLASDHNPFSSVADNGRLIRKLMSSQDFSSLNHYLPDFVYDDCIQLMLQKND